MNDGCCQEGDRQETGDRRFRPFLLSNPLRRFLFPPKKYLDGHVAKGMIVADLGCGPGYLALPAAEAVGEEGRVYAVDSDERHIVALREKAAESGVSNVETHQGSAADVGYIPSATVDLVIAKGLICCMLDHEGALREIQRILKPGGAAFFSVTKFGGKKDRRRVDKEEWEGILSRFVVKTRGEGLTNRWSWVQKSPDH